LNFFQGKIEQFIHDGLRRPMLMGHRQAWVWQDEWCGLTINDIRELEKETQRMLAKKMGNVSNPNLTNIISNEGDEGTLKRRPLKDVNKYDSTIELLSQESLDVSTAEHDATQANVHWRIESFNSSDTDDEFFDAEGKMT
jgi:hypothetical protein